MQPKDSVNLMQLSNFEKKIYYLLSPVAENIGYEIVNVKYSGESRRILDIAIDSLQNNSVSIHDCKKASNNFSAVLDVEELLNEKYYLEVSSAGVERPLNKLADFDRFNGKLVKIKLHEKHNELRHFKCIILGTEDQIIKVKLEDGAILNVPFQNVKLARLVFTDEMFREILSKSKKR
ncbi:MAG: ribosome maturation factor RimP [Rickettsiaceae bacterium]|nr:ribosome maturation factor RimP [Rickettsiaceae bacterium]